MQKTTIALAGNPNVGKSTIFNALTGANQHVGNWPGKTVEKKSGVFEHDGRQITIVDLPGAYSLSAYSPDEEVARDFLVEEQPQLVVNVVDASNIERNLYLTTQILETGVPAIIVLNMQDQASARNVVIHADILSARLGGTPVVESVARAGQGIEPLKEAIMAFLAALESESHLQ